MGRRLTLPPVLSAIIATSGITVWPNAAARRACALPFIFFITIALPFGFLSGLFSWQPTGVNFGRTVLVAFFLPALLEELIFRAPLLWFRQRGSVFWPAVLSLSLFVLWHPLNGWLFLPAAKTLFFDPRFLFIAFGLGLTCTIATLGTNLNATDSTKECTGSLWPAILGHWLLVISWNALLGGPQLL